MEEQATLQPKKERIEYIDALRGFTMILVVFAHVELFGFTKAGNMSLIFQTFRMPLFFFISGFIAYKDNLNWNFRNYLLGIIKKTKIQLIPTIFFGFIYTYFYLNKNLRDFIIDKSKLGYWFTISLLEMFFVLYTINLLSRKKINKVFILIISSTLLYLLKTPFIHNEFLNTIGNILCLHQTFIYFMFFAIGHIASMYKDIFLNILNNKYISAISIVTFFSLSYITFNYDDAVWNSGLLRIYRFLQGPILGVAGIYCIYNYFRIHQDSFRSNNFIGKTLQQIGKRTLDIYLLHYFFIPYIPQVKYIICNHKNITIEMFLGIAISLLIIIICIVISNLIRCNSILGKYLFGAKLS